MDRIEIAPDGEIAVGTFTDADGVPYTCIDMRDENAAVRLYFRVDHFVAAADHLRSVADELVEQQRTEKPNS